MYDVVIVGGGPAGLSAAFFLGNGLKVAIIEKLDGKRYEKYHSMCGHGVSRKTFSKIGLEPQGILNEVNETILKWPDNINISINVKGYVIDRLEFMNSIRKKISADTINGTVIDIEKDNEYYILKLKDGSEIRTRFIIGADGANSIVRKIIFNSESKRMVLMDQFYIEKEAQNSLIFEINEKYKGSYKWTFPHGNMTNMGFVHDYDEESKCISKGGRYIPYGGVGPIVKGNVLLVGDAAGMPNPVSAGGIRAALLSGKKAAESILKNNMKGYQSWWNHSIMSSERFMNVREKLEKWTDEDMTKAVEPFRNGYNIFTITKAIFTRPKMITMYIGCLFAFKFSW